MLGSVVVTQASLSMNALGGTKHSSNLAFTSYTHFVELLETHVIANGGEMVDDQKKVFPHVYT